MSCTVATASPSHAFSSSRISYSSDGPTSPPEAAATCSSPSSLRHRFQRPAIGIRSVPFDRLSSPLGPSSSILKRKRPPMIDIPAAAALSWKEMGSSEVEEEGERYSVFCTRGKKGIDMEDRYKADEFLLRTHQKGFFAVFDGHGGSRAAEFASEKLGERIAEEMTMEGGDRRLAEAVKRGYLKTDAEFLKEDLGGGTCCLTAILGVDGELVVSNAGDCRAVLSRGGASEALTTDHRPSRDDERARIEKLGGYVEHFRGVHRMQGCLAVSRSIGDSHLKPWVSPEPETTILKLDNECEFLIMASDGLWDKVGNQEAVSAARPWIVSGVGKPPKLLTACKELANLAAARGSLDDITVMIIKLSSP